ncbi:MAG: acetyl-CoA carboxylase carboxyltransferase subunit alpha [Hyphomonadaceae bacterium]|nr:acetyl-CoA carboxylase carboxyltransferase subunit alpha [Hyphomonadaceae bacterium]
MQPSARTYLDFERSIAELESKIVDLSAHAASAPGAESMQAELGRLRQKSQKSLEDLYARLDPWQKTQVARHPERPRFKDYLAILVEDFVELAGDRRFGEDAAILGGVGRFAGRPCVLLGQEKGRTTQERLTHNFGMARPEGYRKAVRLMDLAERFSLPVVSLVDTAGAYPGIGAEERGQAEAIARSTERCLTLGVPMVSVIIGEGGSGGAVAILWRDSAKARDAAQAMRITAQDLLGMRVIDGIIPEPLGGAHRHPEDAVHAVGEVVSRAIDELSALDADALRRQRRERFYAIGRIGISSEG